MLRLFLCLTASAAFLGAAEPTVPELAPIPAGDFQMGSSKGHSWEGPVHTVHTESFQVTVSPITNSQYREFRPGHKSAVDAEDAPVTGVNWQEARDYAAWLSVGTNRLFALPTEARWERAVRGGLDQHDYPWGETDSGARQREPAKNGFGVRAVGYNLWEWTSDWYAADYFSSSPKKDPQGPPEGSFRVLRGGGYRDDPASATTYTRGSARPDTRSEHITFRLMEISAEPPAVSETPTTPAVTEARPQPAASPPPQVAAVTTPPPAPAPTPVPEKQPQAAPRPAPAAPTATASPATVTAIDVEGSDTDVTVRVQGTGTLGVKSFALSNPNRIVIDVSGAQMKMPRKIGEIPVALGGVNKVRYALFQPDPPVIRIVIDSERPLKHLIETRSDGFVIQLNP